MQHRPTDAQDDLLPPNPLRALRLCQSLLCLTLTYPRPAAFPTFPPCPGPVARIARACHAVVPPATILRTPSDRSRQDRAQPRRGGARREVQRAVVGRVGRADGAGG